MKAAKLLVALGLVVVLAAPALGQAWSSTYLVNRNITFSRNNLTASNWGTAPIGQGDVDSAYYWNTILDVNRAAALTDITTQLGRAPVASDFAGTAGVKISLNFHIEGSPDPGEAFVPGDTFTLCVLRLAHDWSPTDSNYYYSSFSGSVPWTTVEGVAMTNFNGGYNSAANTYRVGDWAYQQAWSLTPPADAAARAQTDVVWTAGVSTWQTFPIDGRSAADPASTSLAQILLTDPNARGITFVNSTGSPGNACMLAQGGADVPYLSVDVIKYLPGDSNKDRKVSFADYILLANNFGQTSATWGMGDFNGDGKVSFADYILLANNFGQSIPEPATLSLLVLGGLGLIRRRG